MKVRVQNLQAEQSSMRSSQELTMIMVVTFIQQYPRRSTNTKRRIHLSVTTLHKNRDTMRKLDQRNLRVVTLTTTCQHLKEFRTMISLSMPI